MHKNRDVGSSEGLVGGSSRRVVTLLTILKRKRLTEQEVEMQIAEQSEPHLTYSKTFPHIQAE